MPHSVPRCSVRPSTHRCSPHHWLLVSSYRDARLTYEEAREAACGMYGLGSEEFQAFRQLHPTVTFKQWLIQMRQDQP
jgi:hypothetical protein